ncbi:MAG: helix-turn-helix transcriptional regulator [Hyphomicrobium sp.]|nr:helix-turn-helix transcriptional regulator [Hyphomicrobium sp.]
MMSLGQFLAAIRAKRELTLRQVEDGTEKEVSNAYLSQIESGKIKQPSANILSKLAEFYEIDFIQLMELAGYVTPGGKSGDGKKHGRGVALFSELDPTPEEQAELLNHLQYMRWKKKNGDQS